MKTITVFCGNDFSASRKAFLDYLDQQVQNGFLVERIEGKELNSEKIEIISSPFDLFQKKRCLAITGLFSSIRKENREKILKQLFSLDFQIVDWEEKEFTKKEQLSLPNFLFKNYQLPSVIFSFLENLAPGKTKSNLALFQKVIQEKDPQFVFNMIIRQFHLLILVDQKSNSNLPDWQVSRLKKQLQLFSSEKLFHIYKKLLEIDFRQKNSLSPGGLKQELDLLLTEI